MIIIYIYILVYYESQLAGSLLSANKVSIRGLGGGLAQVRQNLAITWGEGWVLGAFFRVMYHAAKG